MFLGDFLGVGSDLATDAWQGIFRDESRKGRKGQVMMKRTRVGVRIGGFPPTEESGAIETLSAQSKVDTRTAIAILVIGVITVLALTFAPGAADGVEPTMADYAAFLPSCLPRSSRMSS